MGEIGMQAEAIRLSVIFFEYVKGFKKDIHGRVNAPENYKLKVMGNFKEVLAGGANAQELERMMHEYREDHDKPQEAYNIEDILKYYKINPKKKVVKRDPNDIMEEGKFYYHPELQIVPPPPVIRQLDNGDFVSSYDEEDFYLEMKDKYTLENLVDYFHKRMEIKGEGFKDRDIGAFKHILKSYDLDTVLYTIDQARFVAEDLSKPIPKTPFDIRDYFDEGTGMLEDRMNTCHMEGLNRVIPRAK